MIVLFSLLYSFLKNNRAIKVLLPYHEFYLYMKAKVFEKSIYIISCIRITDYNSVVAFVYLGPLKDLKASGPLNRRCLVNTCVIDLVPRIS